MKSEPCVLVRVGWMRGYGLSEDEEGPVGGGRWNLDHVGAESENFLVRGDGRCRGYAQPAPRAAGLNIPRIDATASGDSATGVLVVFTAPEGGSGRQVVVGWYRQAACHSGIQHSDDGAWLFEARAEDSVLLPVEERTCEVPRGKGAFGQANVRYTLERDGREAKLPWLPQILDFVRAYSGPNLVATPEAVGQVGEAEAVERAVRPGRSARQGFGLSHEERCAVERRAVDLAIAHYSAAGWRVDDVGSRLSYDLSCTREGEELHVEVKGTTGTGDTILLTRNEVRHAREQHPGVALFVVRDIELSDGPTAAGGVVRVLEPWDIEHHTLEPLAYECRLSGEEVT